MNLRVLPLSSVVGYAVAHLKRFTLSYYGLFYVGSGGTSVPPKCSNVSSAASWTVSVSISSSASSGNFRRNSLFGVSYSSMPFPVQGSTMGCRL